MAVFSDNNRVMLGTLFSEQTSYPSTHFFFNPNASLAPIPFHLPVSHLTGPSCFLLHPWSWASLAPFLTGRELSTAGGGLAWALNILPLSCIFRRGVELLRWGLDLNNTVKWIKILSSWVPIPLHPGNCVWLGIGPLSPWNLLVCLRDREYCFGGCR